MNLLKHMAVYSEMKIRRKRIKIHDEPYWKRTLLCKNRDPNSKKSFEARKPTLGETIRYYLWEGLDWLIYVIAWPFRKLGKIFYGIFWPKSNFSDNGVCGPGYHMSYERHFSWGKLSFVLMVLFIITYLIFLR